MPVLLISGFSESPELRAWAGNDPSIFLPKPFTPDELLDRVQDCLERGIDAARPA